MSLWLIYLQKYFLTHIFLTESLSYDLFFSTVYTLFSGFLGKWKDIFPTWDEHTID